MALRKSAPHIYAPSGLSDAEDGSSGFPGAMLALQNLIPDPGAKNIWVCRPAAVEVTSFPGFANPGFISCMLSVGTLVYGMISTSRNSGKDEPFVYDTVAQKFIVVSGVTSANVPSSLPSSGDWVPPVMVLIGGKIIVAHQGFDDAAGYFIGVLDINNPAAPVWSAGTLSGAITLPSKPITVVLYSGRAWYAVGNAVVFSDTTSATNCTAGNQVLTLGTNQDIVALAGMPLVNQVQGGIVQSLLVFSGSPVVYQISGDPALGTLSLNQMNVPTFTYSQNSVCATPQGTCFVAPDGLRIANLNGTISDPIGIDGQGIVRPFFFTLTPTRIVLSYAVDTIRVSVKFNVGEGDEYQEFFYHLSRKKWSGPHTFPASLVQPVGGVFYEAPVGIPGSIWQSSVVPSSSNTYIENSTPLQFEFHTPLLPGVGDMCEKNVTEQTISAAFSGGVAYNFHFEDEHGNILGSTTAVGSGNSTLWGGFSWGQGVWGGAYQAYSAVKLDYSAPVVFKQAYFHGSGMSSGGFKLGPVATRLASLGYIVAR